ncbi:MAG: hypothetical protein HY966_07545 [Ignavibacteriales bacterium]|nr:hypothetical protein [Ignavibacteriales bacterium]
MTSPKEKLPRLPLFELLRRFKGQMAFALSLVVVENVAWIVEPKLFGSVLDALIDKFSRESSLLSPFDVLPLILWVSAFAVNSGTGVMRRVVDPRIYLKMFSELAREIVAIGKSRRYKTSKTAALAQLSEQYVTFFQFRVPEVIEQIIAIGGAVVALSTFDWRIALTCATIVGPLYVINRLQKMKLAGLQKEFHDIYETTFEVFAKESEEAVQTYYKNYSTAKQRIAFWGALNFGVVRIALLAIFLVVLYIAIDLDDFTTGSIYSIVAYLWTFITMSEYIPELMESWTSLKDISRRLHAESI